MGPIHPFILRYVFQLALRTLPAVKVSKGGMKEGWPLIRALAETCTAVPYAIVASRRGMGCSISSATCTSNLLRPGSGQTEYLLEHALVPYLLVDVVGISHEVNEVNNVFSLQARNSHYLLI